MMSVWTYLILSVHVDFPQTDNNRQSNILQQTSIFDSVKDHKQQVRKLITLLSSLKCFVRVSSCVFVCKHPQRRTDLFHQSIIN